MINILLLSHGNYSKEIVKSAEMIVGKQCNVHAVGLASGENIDGYREKIATYIGELGSEHGVLIFTDLYGGTPSNTVALSFHLPHSKNAEFECIAGFNFPMILEAITMRNQLGLSELKDHCLKIGSASIKDIRHEITLMER